MIATPHQGGGVTYVFDDVTERLDLERRFDALISVQGEALDNVAEALAVFGSDGRVRLFNRSGYDWTDRYPLIVAAADVLPADATVDGEVVVCDDAGVSDFERLHSRTLDRVAFLWAFDLLELDGEDLRARPLFERKGALDRLLRRAKIGIQFNEHFRDGAKAFAHACQFGLKGIISKDRSSPYRSGPSKTWLKIKRPTAARVRRFEGRS